MEGESDPAGLSSDRHILAHSFHICAEEMEVPEIFLAAQMQSYNKVGGANHL